MNGFNSYKSDLGFDIGSGLSGQSTYIKKKTNKITVFSWRNNINYSKCKKQKFLLNKNSGKNITNHQNYVIHIGCNTFHYFFITYHFIL